MQGGFLKMMRTAETLELLINEPNAFRLAAIIAWRCRWRDGFNAQGLTQGEALLGDCNQCGLTEKEYRTAKAKLQKWKFAAFKRAVVGKRRGTIGRLLDTRLFDTSPQPEFNPKGGARADEGRSKGEKRRSLEEGRKKDGRRLGLANAPQAPRSPLSNFNFLHARFPATAEEVFEFGSSQELDWELCARFIRYNNFNGWKVHGEPIGSWQAVLLKFRDSCLDSPGEVSAVPDGWTPEIVIPDDCLDEIEDLTTATV